MARGLVFGLLCGVLLMAAPAAAQEGQGPPPELRQNLQAFVKGFNAGPAEYEAMAKDTFSPAFYKSQSADARREVYTKLRADFGTIQIQTVERDAPDAPLVISVKGSTASGTFWIDLDDNHRVAGVRARPAKAPAS